VAVAVAVVVATAKKETGRRKEEKHVSFIFFSFSFEEKKKSHILGFDPIRLVTITYRRPALVNPLPDLCFFASLGTNTHLITGS
jgi:hypothetical protein